MESHGSVGYCRALLGWRPCSVCLCCHPIFLLCIVAHVVRGGISFHRRKPRPGICRKTICAKRVQVAFCLHRLQFPSGLASCQVAVGGKCLASPGALRDSEIEFGAQELASSLGGSRRCCPPLIWASVYGDSDVNQSAGLIWRGRALRDGADFAAAPNVAFSRAPPRARTAGRGWRTTGTPGRCAFASQLASMDGDIWQRGSRIATRAGWPRKYRAGWLVSMVFRGQARACYGVSGLLRALAFSRGVCARASAAHYDERVRCLHKVAGHRILLVCVCVCVCARALTNAWRASQYRCAFFVQRCRSCLWAPR